MRDLTGKELPIHKQESLPLLCVQYILLSTVCETFYFQIYILKYISGYEETGVKQNIL